MPNRIQIIKHELFRSNAAVEVCFADGRESKFFYWDDLPGRRLRPEILTSEQAREEAKARAERDGEGN